jgi:predicted metal-dependent hydrolase
MSTVEFKNKVAPLHRNLKFNLSKDVADNWNPAGVPFTQFMNTLSIFFPAGEKFFMDSIQNYRDQITDPQLQKDIKEFMGQEALHTREHLVYNQALIDAGFPVDKYMNRVEKLLKRVQKVFPNDVQLAVTISLEHLTASLGDTVLTDPKLMENAETNFSNIWYWHSMEEIEHKGVAYDVWNDVMGSGLYSYSIRSGVHVLTHLVFWSLVIPFHIGLVRKSKKLSNFKGWISCMNYLWGKPGALRRIFPDMIDYFRPGFHPWQHDNSKLLDDIDDFSESVKNEYKHATAT